MAGSHQAPKKTKRAEEAYRTERDTEERRSTERATGFGAWFVPTVSALCILLVLLLAVGGFALYVDNCDRIFPNVRLEGVDVGGMTRSAAELTMEQNAPEGYAGKTVTVTLPMSRTLEVQAETVGLGGSRRSAVETAYRYGREGSIVENTLIYIRCLLGHGVDIQWEGAALDETALMNAVESVTVPLNAELKGATAELRDDAIVLIKGAGAVQIDPAVVCELVRDAFAGRSYEPIKYAPVFDGDQGVDVEQLYEEFHTEPVNASYDKETEEIIDGIDGVEFDTEEAQRIMDAAAAGDEVSIPVTRTTPSVTTELLCEGLFRDCLAVKGTSLSGSSSARINNIELAAEAMDDTVLLPGEEFSYNDCLGERTTDKGYQEAGAYANGQHTTAVGGGICQGSSTLYYCAIKANLEITERWDHYFAVSYLPMGMDATVSWYSPNFKFVNSREYPIWINAYTENGELIIEIWGTDVDGSYVDITSDGWEDAEFYYAQTYRNVYDADGNLISSEAEASSRYHKYEATE